jgi:hypothetical protein
VTATAYATDPAVVAFATEPETAMEAEVEIAGNHHKIAISIRAKKRSILHAQRAGDMGLFSVR